MIIRRIPQRSDEKVEFFVSGDVLTLNGTEYDFSPLGEGDMIFHFDVSCEFIKGDDRGVIYRKDGQVHLSILDPQPAPSESAS